ncbi:MAG: protein-disulfide reductase DsbD domain-containing protein [Vicinamibacterales bacterium]
MREGATPFGPARTIDTAHLTVTAAISDDKVAPGKRLTMLFDVTPRRGMHIYAPGKHSYQVIRVAMRQEPWLSVHEMHYPASEIFYFAPLDERVEVFMKPFRLTQDVTVLATPEVQKLLADKTELTIAGTLEYQACDEKLCYAPQSVPFEWTLPLSQLDRKPSGGGR